jgi:RNA polymerase sigma-70 factor (ECF subfamily)
MQMDTSVNYERIYREYRPTVYAYISARVSYREDAEDLCQHVFVKLYKALETFDGEKASMSTFVYLLSHNAVIDYYRTSHRHDVLSEDDAVLPSAENVVMDRAKAEEIAAALSQLPQEQRDILVLRFYRGWTLARIAQETGLTYDTVVSRQKSAFEKLRKILKERIE